MGQKIKLDDEEYDIEYLSDQAKVALVSMQFATQRLKELSDIHALYVRAKNGYIADLKHEMISQKAGFDFEID
jgi:hypothetical protein